VAPEMYGWFYLLVRDPATGGNCVQVVSVPMPGAAPSPLGPGTFPGVPVLTEISPTPTGLGAASATYGVPICPSSLAAILPHLLSAEVRRNLAVPHLHIAPGEAITGKPAYLEITEADERDIVLPNPLGGADVIVHVVPTYTVDWGDGTEKDTTTSHGGPWPNGDVTHVYQDAHPVTVVVTVDWRVTWQATTLPGAFRTQNQLPLPIEQVQAVIVPAG
jgi:hypothetical protein